MPREFVPGIITCNLEPTTAPQRMAWTDLIDQERVTASLQRAVETGRVAHAYLFHGPDGVGKRAVALEFAKTLLCERGEGTACGECRACRKVARMVHPDVHVLFAQHSDVDHEDVAARLERLGEDPYAFVDFVRRPVLDDPSKTSNKQAFYSIDRVHEELLHTMSYRPVEGRYKVAILTDAELMRREGANAFLKLLEEPAPQTLFILTTARPDLMLPTILSRCQRFRFDALAPEAVEQALAARREVEPDRAATLARMADGSYGRALELIENEDLMAGRRIVLDYLRRAYTGDINKLAELVEQMSRSGRERLKGLLRLLLRWVRDLMLYRALGDQAPLVNVDQAGAVARFCDNVPDADLEAMVQLVEEAIDLVERNVNSSLVLTVLAQKLRAAMYGGRPDALYVPLAHAQPL